MKKRSKKSGGLRGTPEDHLFHANDTGRMAESIMNEVRSNTVRLFGRKEKYAPGDEILCRTAMRAADLASQAYAHAREAPTRPQWAGRTRKAADRVSAAQDLVLAKCGCSRRVR